MKKITLLLLLSAIYLVSFGQGITVRTAPVSATWMMIMAHLLLQED